MLKFVRRGYRGDLYKRLYRHTIHSLGSTKDFKNFKILSSNRFLYL